MLKNNQHAPDDLSADAVYRRLVEFSPVGIFVLREGRFRYVNRALARIFGYKVEDIVGKLGLLDLVDREYRRKLSEAISSCLKGELPEVRLRFRGMTQEEEPIYAEVHACLTAYKESIAIAGIIEDYNDHSKADEILNETLSRYRSFFNEDIAAHYISSPDGKILDCNNTFARLFGFPSRKDALKADASSLYPVATERVWFLELVKERRRLSDHKAEYVRPDGKRVYVKENAVGEFDGEGNLTYIRGHIIDETSEKRLEEQLFQSQRLETLGTLVGGIAHDFNNILGVITGHVSLMERWRSDPERFEKSFQAVTKATERGANTVKQLLTFARKVEIVTESVRIDEVVKEIVALLRETFPEKIVFEVKVESGIPTIHADSNQLHQVLMNLLVNARDAMPKGGTIRIAAKEVARDLVSRRFREVEADRYVEVTVSDTGTGIDADTLNRIFEPFFTTKRAGHGSGLGLSVVYGIVKAHNGFIGVESRVGQGTTFSLYFPIPLQTIEAVPQARKSTESPKGNGEVILAIEDEDLLRDFLKTILEENGYKVVAAPDGIKGLQAYREHVHEIDIVLLDMGLPEMSGAEVLAELKMLNPDVKVILASGYLEPEMKNDAFQIGALDFMPKPYQTDDLLMRIRDALQAKGKQGP